MDMGDIVLKSADGQMLFSGKLEEFKIDSLSTNVEVGLDTELSIDMNRSNEFSVGLQDINYKEMEELFMPQTPQTYNVVMDVKMPVYIQARRHKQKRINKKWLKKYGCKVVYKSKQMRVDSCSMIPAEDGRFEVSMSSKIT